MKRKTFLWSLHDEKEIKAASDAAGMTVTEFVLAACREKMTREEEAKALSGILSVLKQMREESAAQARGVGQLLTQNSEVEMSKFKTQLAHELDEHLKIIADMFKRFEQTGKAPRPKGAGIDINNM